MRIRFLVAVATALAVVLGGQALQDSADPVAASVGGARTAYSGSWLCPHGGSPHGWIVRLELANPGSRPVPVRITTFGKDDPEKPRMDVVRPHSVLRIRVPGDQRARTSMVEYFGGWVAAGWVAEATGLESGIAAEPCLPATSTSWLVPGGTTVQGQDTWVIVMNPAATPAVFSLQIDSEQGAVLTKDWSDIVLQRRRSAAFLVNETALGRHIAVAEVDVSIGRVAVAGLGVSRDGGVRSVVGLPAPRSRSIMPGGDDTGHTELSIVAPGPGRTTYEGSLDRKDGTQVLSQLKDQVLGPHDVRLFGVATTDPSTLDLRAQGDSTLGAARETFGPGPDQGATGGLPRPRRAWLIPSGASDRHDRWQVILANPGPMPAKVTLQLLTPGGLASERGPRTFVVPPLRTLAVPPAYTRPYPLASAVAVARTGTFVAAAVSDTFDGTHYAVTAGIAIPAAWVPISA